MEELMKKIFVLAMLLFCVAVMAAENLFNVIAQTEDYIESKYKAGSRARVTAENQLDEILSAQGKSDAEKIAEIKSKFPEAFQDQPLVYLPKVSFHAHSLGLSYKIEDSATTTASEVDIFTTLTSEQRQNNTSRQRHRTQGSSGFDADGSVKGTTQSEAETSDGLFAWLKAKFSASISLSGSCTYGKTSEDLTELWSLSQQELFSNNRIRISEMISQVNISGFHLRFTVTITNNSQDAVSLNLDGFSIPVYVNGTSTNEGAKPIREKEDDPTVITILPGNTIDVRFRMDLNNTLVRSLIQDMSQGEPQIRLDRSNWQISVDGKRINLTAEPATSKIKFNFPGFSVVWRLRRLHTSDGTPTTLKERLEAIAKIFEEKLDKSDLLSWEAETLTAISGVPFGAFSENDLECRYIAFLQIGNQYYDRITPELLATSPTEDCTVWIIDLNNMPDNLHSMLKKLIFEKTKIRADQGNPSAQCFLANMYLDGFHVESNPTEAVRYFRLAADKGNAAAQHVLGSCYMHGIGVERNLPEAVKYLRLAAEKGYVDAQIGLCYMEGIGVERNLPEAVKYLRLAAEKGYADAQCLLGRCYRFGIGVESNPTEAVNYFRSAAEQGYADAQYLLGRCYRYGIGIERNLPEAVKFFELAANQGNAKAQYWLGYCYYHGIGVEKNACKAVEYFRLAAEQGSTMGQYSLGDCYYYGNGVEKNQNEAVNYFRSAAEQGYAKAQVTLGRCYLYGIGIEKNVTEAFRYFELAADKEDTAGQVWLGRCYKDGIAVERNLDEAIRYFRLAANQGYADAQYWLGRCYRFGIGVERHLSEAAKYFKLAADNGSLAGQIWIGHCYYDGIGVEKNPNEAIRYYRMAAEQGNAYGQFLLGVCYVEKNPTEAVRYLRLAAAQGDAQGQTILGMCYLNGIGVEENLTDAIRYLELAANKELSQAQYTLGYCYENGRGVRRNLDEAIRYYRLAANQGLADAQAALRRLGQ